MNGENAAHLQRAYQYNGALRAIKVSVNGGVPVRLRAGDRIPLETDVQRLSLEAKSGFSKARWEGECSSGDEFEVGFRGVVEMLMTGSSIYITRVTERVNRPTRYPPPPIMWVALVVIFGASMAGLMLRGPGAWEIAGIVSSGLLALLVLARFIRNDIAHSRTRQR